MTIEITEKVTTEYATYISMATEKKAAFVSINNDGTIQVICKNAAHAAFNGAGRFFNSIQEAVEGYKSGAMKAMIQTAAEQSLKSL